MAKAVADQFAETLAAAGVRRINGVVGDSLNGLTDSIRRQGKDPRGCKGVGRSHSSEVSQTALDPASH